jgi:hypothetical protein
MTNKIAGLYVALAKALNALADAEGEHLDDGIGLLTEIYGPTGAVRWDPETERYTVVQA